MIGESGSVPGMIQSTLEKLSGQKLQEPEPGKGFAFAEGPAKGGSPTARQYIERAIQSTLTFRVKWGKTDLSSADNGIEKTDDEVVITIDRSKLGDKVWSAEEILAEKLVLAVTQHSPSAEQAPEPASSHPGESPLARITVDELMQLPLSGTDQREKQRHLESYAAQNLPHLSKGRQKLAYQLGWMASGIPFSEILRGIEMDTPFRFKQEIKDGRVFATYFDPQGFPADADKLDTAAFLQLLFSRERAVTFLPGENEELAKPVALPKTGQSCTDAEQKDSANSCCSEPMLAEFRGHLSTARAYLSRARKRLTGGENTGCQVRKHFKGEAEGKGLEKILARLDLAEGELYLSRHGWKCRRRKTGLLGCDRRMSGAKEGYVGGSVRKLDTNILICVDGDAPFTEWTTVLHEVMHRVGTSGKEVYAGDPAYPGDDPVNNADSYAGLVEELGKPDWSPCTPWPISLRLISGSNFGHGLVLGARTEFTPLGPGLRIVDWKLGLQFLWLPRFGVIDEAGDPARNVLGRGYFGGDTGVQLNLPQSYGSLHFEAAAGLGLLFDEGVRPAASARLVGSYRFGKGPSGFELGLELGRLQNLTDKAGGDWIIGLSAGYRFGRTPKRKR